MLASAGPHGESRTPPSPSSASQQGEEATISYKVSSFQVQGRGFGVGSIDSTGFWSHGLRPVGQSRLANLSSVVMGKNPEVSSLRALESTPIDLILSGHTEGLTKVRQEDQQ